MSEVFLSQEEFENFKEEDKWNYIDGLYKTINRLQIRADKNCEECESEMLAMDDINIDLLFEDWRECSNHCDECNKDTRTIMCQAQFELINLIANSLAELRRKQNILTSLVIKRDSRGSKLLKKMEEDRELAKKKAASLYG